MFSTIRDISDPTLFFFNIFSKLFLEFSSIDKGETATGSGLRLPLVISTSIKPNDFIGDKIHKISKTINFNSFKDFNEIILSDYNSNQDLLIQPLNECLNLYDLKNNTDVTETLMLNDLKYYLPDDILVKVDRAAMNNSLETRMPFLSRDVINLSWQLPMDQKIHKGNSKYILKKILSDYLPFDLIEKKKRGFAIPLADWLRNDLHDWVMDSFSKNLITQTNIFNYNEVMNIWKDHKSNKKNNHSLLWSILILQNWLQKL